MSSVSRRPCMLVRYSSVVVAATDAPADCTVSTRLTDISYAAIPRVTPPRYARQIVRFVERAIDRDQHIAYLPAERRRAIYRRFAYVSDQLHRVGVGVFVVGVGELPHEHGEHQSGMSVRYLVVAAELPFDRDRFPHFRPMFRHGPFGRCHGYQIELFAQPRHAYRKLVEPLAVQLMTERGLGHHDAA